MPAHKKMKIYRSEKYLKWIRSKPCIICGKASQAQNLIISLDRVPYVGYI